MCALLPAGCLKLIDFGLSQVQDQDGCALVMRGTGTPGCSAPEVSVPLPGHPNIAVATLACDVYSFGQALAAVAEALPCLEHWLGPVIKACTLADPLQRRTMAEVANLLSEASVEAQALDTDTIAAFIAAVASNKQCADDAGEGEDRAVLCRIPSSVTASTPDGVSPLNSNALAATAVSMGASQHECQPTWVPAVQAATPASHYAEAALDAFMTLLLTLIIMLSPVLRMCSRAGRGATDVFTQLCSAAASLCQPQAPRSAPSASLAWSQFCQQRRQRFWHKAARSGRHHSHRLLAQSSVIGAHA